jgi:hypothetical protein
MNGQVGELWCDIPSSNNLRYFPSWRTRRVEHVECTGAEKFVQIFSWHI